MEVVTASRMSHPIQIEADQLRCVSATLGWSAGVCAVTVMMHVQAVGGDRNLVVTECCCVWFVISLSRHTQALPQAWSLQH
jgi:hypothetical protein